MEQVVLKVHSSDLTGGCRMEDGECSALDGQIATLERLGLSEERIQENIELTKKNCRELGRCSLVYTEGGQPNA